jgi:hypothetical protein
MESGSVILVGGPSLVPLFVFLDLALPCDRTRPGHPHRVLLDVRSNVLWPVVRGVSHRLRHSLDAHKLVDLLQRRDLSTVQIAGKGRIGQLS